MELPRKKRDETSATITQTLWLIVACSGLFMLTAYASVPSWWSTTTGPTNAPSAVMAPQVITNDDVVTTNYVRNDYAVVSQGQLKQFTARAVDELNSGLTNYGGAGTNLTNLVYGWIQDYATNGYATNMANPTKPYKPSDLQAENVGQLKYIGNLVWEQLVAAGYTNVPPSWLDVNTNTDYAVANQGQLKTVFDFDLSSFASDPHITSTSTASGIVGTAFSFTNTANNSPTSFSATGLPAGLSIDTSNGVISGTNTSGGTYTVVVSATNGSGTTYSTLTLTFNIPLSIPAITSGTNASGIVGQPFSYEITANNAPTSFGASGLPSGLTIDDTNGWISGTPTTAGTNTVTLDASNSGGTGTNTLTLTITDPSAPVITSGTNVTGDVGVAFSYAITATSNPTSFSASGLPSGLSTDTNTGVISGTPAATGTTNVTLNASNAGGTGTNTLTLTINSAGAPIITSPTTASAFNTNLPSFTNSPAFSYPITATSNPTSFNATGLPTGLSVDTSNGVISGNPTATNTFTSSVVISAANGSGTGSTTLMLSVNPPAPAITSSTNATGSVGSEFIYATTANNTPTSFSATGLPPGLSIDPTTGVISGTPTVASATPYTLTLSATNAGGTGTATLTLTIGNPVPPPVITSSTLVTGDEGVSFSYAITTTTAAPPPSSFGASGLPSGLSIDTSNGVISGTPTATGTSTVTLSATNGWGTAIETLTLIITPADAPVITSATMASGTVGSTYTDLYTVTATNSPTSYGASGLPLGLSFNSSTGVISGTPELVGTSAVLLTSSNTAGTGEAILTLTINPPAPVITSPRTASGAFGVAFAYTIAASNSPTSYSATGLPPGLIIDTSTGEISGTPTNTGIYTVTLGATNAGGTGLAMLTLTVNGSTSPILTRSISTGINNTLILKSDGTVWAAGDSRFGQVEYAGNSALYTQVAGLSGIVAVAQGYHCTYALDDNGHVWAWGYNGDGDLGNNSYTDSTTPVEVEVSGGSALSGIIAIAAGFDGAMALKSDGSVWTWGYNGDGESGNGTYTDNPTAVEVLTATTPSSVPLSNIVAIACGAHHDLAVDNSGNVWVWGYDLNGELGDGGGADSPLAVSVSLPSGVFITSVAGGTSYSLAVATDGTVWGWGDQSNGYLGDGFDVAGNMLPLQAVNSTGQPFTGVVSISCQGDHALALRNDGTVWAWGQNDYGQLGIGMVSQDSPYPVQVSNLSGAIAVSAGYSSNTALRNDDSIWGWGYNGATSNYGAAGRTTPVTLPATVPGLTGVTAIAGAHGHYLALDTSGSVWAWNDITPGEISDGATIVGSSSAVKVQGLSGITAIACGDYFNLALDGSGEVWAWGGDNAYGELGNGTTGLVEQPNPPLVDTWGQLEDLATLVSNQTPAPVMTMSGSSLVALSNIKAIACGSFFGMALDGTGAIWTWGFNWDGELGNGTASLNDDTDVAGQVSSSNTFTAIAAGSYHAVALDNDSNVWAWGANDFGEIGWDPAYSNSAIPVQVSGLSGITAITAGAYDTVALTSSGTVMTFGLNDAGQLGNGSTTNSYAPVEVSGLTNITAIKMAEDSYHCAALEVSGTNQTLWTWGDNSNGELGIGLLGPTSTNASPTGSTVPVKVIGLDATISTSNSLTNLACGKYSTAALTSAGTVLQWGDTSYEPFGFSVPIQVASPQTNSPPVISPAAGYYASSQTVSISTSLTGTIYYTLDGTEPTTSSTAYTEAFTLSGDALVSAAVFVDGVRATPIATSQFYIGDTSQTGLPDTVTGLSVTAGDGQIDLSWSLGSLVDYSAIDVYRSSDGGATYQLIAVLSPSTTTYIDTNVQSGTNYKYIVGTLDASGIADTSASSPVSLTAPSALTITVTTPAGVTYLP